MEFRGVWMSLQKIDENCLRRCDLLRSSICRTQRQQYLNIVRVHLPGPHQGRDCTLKILCLEQRQPNLLIDAGQSGMLLLFEHELACGCIVLSVRHGFDTEFVMTGFAGQHTCAENDRSNDCNQLHSETRTDHSDTIIPISSFLSPQE